MRSLHNSYTFQYCFQNIFHHCRPLQKGADFVLFNCYYPKSQIIIKQMNCPNLAIKHPKILRKQHSEGEKHGERPTHRFQIHRFSEPRNKIKISKNKLPADFFLKKDLSSRRISQQKLFFPEAFSEPFLSKKVESERAHISPQKTSFFGFFDEKETQNLMKFSSGSKMTGRKFESREQPKRDAFTVEIARKLMTTANEPVKYQLLELFPSTYNNQLTEVMTSSSKSHNLKPPMKKQLTARQRDADPEKYQQHCHSGQLGPIKSTQMEKGLVKPSNAGLERNNQICNEMNITFSNTLSKCLPPIKRHA